MAVSTRKVFIFLIISIHVSHGINLGLIAGDLKLPSKPLSINKYSRHSPIVININSKPKLLPDLPPLPKLPSKPPPLELPKLYSPSPFKSSFVDLPKLTSSKLKMPKLPLTWKLSKLGAPLLPLIPPVPFSPPIIPPFFPIIPKLPLLPILPPIIPPFSIIPTLPLLSPFSPLKVPILGKTPFQKALGSELKPIVVPSPSCTSKKNIMDKLVNLKNKGTLSSSEYLRFKKLLL